MLADNRAERGRFLTFFLRKRVFFAIFVITTAALFSAQYLQLITFEGFFGQNIFLSRDSQASSPENERTHSWRECPSISLHGDWDASVPEPRFIESTRNQYPYPRISYDSHRKDLLPLKGKWVYFYGDSTVRQLATDMINATDHFIGYDFYKFREFFRSGNCTPQLRPESSSPTPCQMNERRCEFTPKQLGGYEITFDWKHFALEDYDHYLFKTFFKQRRPDVLIVSFGIHDCYHGNSFSDFETKSKEFFKMLNDTYTGPILWMDTQAWVNIECTEKVNKLHLNLVEKYGWPRFGRYPATRVLFNKGLNRDFVHIHDKSSDDIFYMLLPQILCMANPDTQIPIIQRVESESF